MRDYEPPLSEKGGVLIPGQEPEIYPGVKGYAVEHDGAIYIPLIIGDGTGKVSEMLDRLTYRCRIVGVVSSKLREMLFRHGWRMNNQYDAESDCTVDVWTFRQNL